jgi:hypothetical protein
VLKISDIFGLICYNPFNAFKIIHAIQALSMLCAPNGSEEEKVEENNN